MQVTTIGLDLAKSIFQVHGIDAVGAPSFARRCAGLRCCPSSRAWRLALSV